VGWEEIVLKTRVREEIILKTPKKLEAIDKNLGLHSVGEDDELVDDHGKHLRVEFLQVVHTVGVVSFRAVVLQQEGSDVSLML
jgi:hypothetical protein